MSLSTSEKLTHAVGSKTQRCCTFRSRILVGLERGNGLELRKMQGVTFQKERNSRTTEALGKVEGRLEGGASWNEATLRVRVAGPIPWFPGTEEVVSPPELPEAGVEKSGRVGSAGPPLLSRPPILPAFGRGEPCMPAARVRATAAVPAL